MKELLIEHLKELKSSLERWKTYKRISFAIFLSDVDKQNMIMHGMLRAIQAAIDAGNDMIAMNKLENPSSYAEIFDILQKGKVIDKALANSLSSLARFRNVLVHLYWKVDLKRTYFTLKKGDSTLEKFYLRAKRFL